MAGTADLAVVCGDFDASRVEFLPGDLDELLAGAGDAEPLVVEAFVNVVDVDAVEFLDLLGDLPLEFLDEERFGR